MFLGIGLVALPGIVVTVLAGVELVGRLVALVVPVGTQRASRIEGLDSHELSRLFGHFDSVSSVLLVD